ncbi:biogenesis of lysosome-related organelles complex 1 subunit 6-like [Neocloeon triangulifer]|uniref:biogenesis of lysosome-related organelles complex 1 subunit 6-like n=1 Tax=Neocloeon triangulifer TaxID=2078957 RepID=UPI00286F078B|nr:biogenesis of lysosome-related organelles complex 1 subunit 6-like [Neocloeon triangulifer]
MSAKSGNLTDLELKEEENAARKSHGLLDDDEAAALGTAVLNIYEPSLTKVRQQLAEASTKQHLLIEQLQCENERLELGQSEYNLQETFAKVKVYHAKLVSIKKDMAMLHEKSTKLKKRANRLQEHCQKQALQKELDKDRQMQRELKLVEDTTK